MSQRIAVVMGGRSSEHEISLKSGEQVMKALAEDTPLRVVIGQDGGWTIDGQRHTLGSAIDRLTSEASVVFLALHGAFGEDGTIQGLLDMAGLAYTGSGVVGSALPCRRRRVTLRCNIASFDAVSATQPKFFTVRRHIGDRWPVYPMALVPLIWTKLQFDDQ